MMRKAVSLSRIIFMEVKMNNFKKYAIAAFSISLLMSAPAQAVGFAELYKQAGQYAQNLWANRPSMPAISIPQISMPSVSRAQVEAGIEAVANYAQKTEAVLAQYPKTVAATKMAAKVVPVVLAGGYLAKKGFNKFCDYQAQRFDKQFAELNRHLNEFQAQHGDNSLITLEMVSTPEDKSEVIAPLHGLEFYR